MSENRNKIPIPPKQQPPPLPPRQQQPPMPPISTPPLPQIPQQPNPIVALAQAINDLNRRMSIVEIEVHKANTNCEILKKTIELIEKRMEFNEKK